MGCHRFTKVLLSLGRKSPLLNSLLKGMRTHSVICALLDTPFVRVTFLTSGTKHLTEALVCVEGTQTYLGWQFQRK